MWFHEHSHLTKNSAKVIAQLVKCLLYKHEFDTQNPCNKVGHGVYAGGWGGVHGDPWGSLARQPSLMNEFLAK